MTLPPKVINALVRIKAELLSRPQEESVIITHDPLMEQSKQVMRHARRPSAFQKMCHRREFTRIM